MTDSTGTTHVLAVIDMSGSMSHLASDVRGGFNTYIATLRDDTEAKYRVTVTVFDTVFENLCTGVKLKNVPELTESNYMPRGMTALCDAIGKTITEFESRVTLGTDDNALLVVQTDGLENSSREFNATLIKELVTTREASGKWQALFLGASLDAISQAGGMGFATHNTVDTSLGGTMDAATSVRSTYAGVGMSTRAYSRNSADTALGTRITEVLEDDAE